MVAGTGFILDKIDCLKPNKCIEINFFHALLFA